MNYELAALYDFDRLPVYTSSVSAQVSTYDTTGGNDDGFGGKYSFLRRNSDSTLVIFDVQGPAVIDRIWTPTPTDDTLDFFLDGAVKPTFSIKYSDLFSGEKFPFVAPLCGNQIGGFYCYLPIPFAKRCKIVCRGKKLQFHQIQYRMYETGATVKTFNMELNDDETKTLKKIKSIWEARGTELGKVLAESSSSWKEETDEIVLAPGKSSTVFESDKGGRIMALEISPAAVFEGLVKTIDIKITWDNEKIPAVYSPVADFFGFAFGTSSMQSLLLGSKDNINYCYFPMPYDNHCKVELMYRAGEPDQGVIKIKTRVLYSDALRDRDREGKFYAHWNKIAKSEKGKAHVFLSKEGRGHYVGSILQAQGLKAGMTYFFEGDDSTVVDGVMQLHGTGSEDYFNGGWYAMLDRWDGKVSLPLHGSLDYSLPFCRTGGYRLYLSDKISFKKYIFHSIEHGPRGNAFPVDYTSLALFYADGPATDVLKPTNELSNVFVPDTLMIYPQLMNVTTSGSIDFRSAWKYNTGGESFTYTTENNSWLRISMDEIPEGEYALYMDLIKKPDGCDFSLWQRQTRISPVLRTNSPHEQRDEGLYVCDLNVGELTKTITIRFSVHEKKNSFLLNRLIFVKKGG
ncbi:MAG TPA: glycoside hydrolase family 172 protein [Cyclobacteriaceae bacterium]|nr:glycoside hydrolase family 172 protein [Cyclobacteriaceae bacterium]